MNKIIIAAAAALLTAAGSAPSFAQSSTAGAGTMAMPSITCRDLSAMDQQTARNVVFYLSGLNAAQSASSAMNSTAGSGSSSTSADASNTGSSASAGTATDTTGSTTAAGSSGTASSGAASTSTIVAQLPGFSMINADQVISTCQGSPDMQLSTVLGTSPAAQ